MRIVEALHDAFPAVTYDVTIKVEHLLQHRRLLPLLAATGCAFVTSAVESVDDEVLAAVEKGHTRADFLEAVALCRAAGLTLVPTFVAFTPWTTLERLLRTARHDRRARSGRSRGADAAGDPAAGAAKGRGCWSSTTCACTSARSTRDADVPWTHPDPRVDELQRESWRWSAAR